MITEDKTIVDIIHINPGFNITILPESSEESHRTGTITNSRGDIMATVFVNGTMVTLDEEYWDKYGLTYPPKVIQDMLRVKGYSLSCADIGDSEGCDY